MVKCICDLIHLFPLCDELVHHRKLPCDKQNLDMLCLKFFLISLNHQIADRCKIQSFFDCFFTHSNLLFLIHAGRQHHIPFRNDLKFCKFQLFDPLVRFILVFNRIYLNPCDPGKRDTFFDFRKIRSI